MDFMRLSSPLPFMHETVGGDFKSPRTVNSLLIVVIIFCLEVGGGATRRLGGPETMATMGRSFFKTDCGFNEQAQLNYKENTFPNLPK